MDLTLTADQHRQWEQHRACVVPGELCVDEGHPDGYECPPDCSGAFPPEQFRVANEPCQTCDGEQVVLQPDQERWETPAGACPDCRGGKPVVELRVPCKFCDGTNPDCAPGYVVARATVTLLPVVSYDDNLTRPLFLQWGRRGIFYDGEWERDIDFDPLPVAGRDWVAAFEEVS